MNSITSALQYCTHLSKNVVMQLPGPSGGGTVCLNRFECGFCDCGCRNLLTRVETTSDGGLQDYQRAES